MSLSGGNALWMLAEGRRQAEKLFGGSFGAGVVCVSRLCSPDCHSSFISTVPVCVAALVLPDGFFLQVLKHTQMVEKLLIDDNYCC